MRDTQLSGQSASSIECILLIDKISFFSLIHHLALLSTPAKIVTYSTFLPKKQQRQRQKQKLVFFINLFRVLEISLNFLKEGLME